jgi:PilZ domain-containing protein
MGMRERRAAHRYRLDVPIIVRRLPTLRDNDVLSGEIRNISTGGIYFTVDRRLAADELVDFSLTFAGLVEGADVLVRGRARVLRVVQKPEAISERVGIGAVIENFQILRPGRVEE